MTLPFFSKQKQKFGNCAVAVRMDRRNEREWQKARSCVGGAPDIPEKDWPTGMHCVAQIDLSEIAALNIDSSLPTSGALAFFVDTAGFAYGRLRGAVREVPVKKIGNFEPSMSTNALYGTHWDM